MRERNTSPCPVSRKEVARRHSSGKRVLKTASGIQMRVPGWMRWSDQDAKERRREEAARVLDAVRVRMSKLAKG